MTKLAILSDIHANLPALEAVVSDIHLHRPDAVYVLGDMINGCAWPVETLDLIESLEWPMVIGNHDDAVLQLGAPRMEPRYADQNYYATLWWTRARLSQRHLDLLEDLPQELGLTFPDAPALRLLHGLPGNLFVGFRPDSPTEWVARKLAPISEPAVADAHTHFPMVRSIGRWQVINSGSVGAPYDNDPRAGYVLLTGAPEEWHVEIRRVEYDRQAAQRGYLTSGLLAEGGVLAEMFRRTVLTGLPYVSDFNWWVRYRAPEGLADQYAALAAYDAQHGPEQWAFPLPA